MHSLTFGNNHLSYLAMTQETFLVRDCNLMMSKIPFCSGFHSKWYLFVEKVSLKRIYFALPLFWTKSFEFKGQFKKIFQKISIYLPQKIISQKKELKLFPSLIFKIHKEENNLWNHIFLLCNYKKERNDEEKDTENMLWKK